MISIGVIGTGRIASRFLGEMNFIDGMECRTVYNPHPVSAKSFAMEYHLEPFYQDAEEIRSFDKFLESVDAIYIASPHETHFEYSKRALLAGKHVLCEKPMALNKTNAVEIHQIADQLNKIFMQGIKTNYFPGFRKLVEVAQSGKIGEIKDVEACFTRLTDPNKREMQGGPFNGSFLEFGSYTLLPAFKLLGTDFSDIEFKSILAENGTDQYTKAYLSYWDESSNNILATATAKTGLGVKSDGHLIVAGTKGYILAPAPWWLTRHFEIHYEDPNLVETFDFEIEGNGMRDELREFVNRINGQKTSAFMISERAEDIAICSAFGKFLQHRKTLA